MEVGKYIDASRRRKIGTDLQAERTFHEVTHTHTHPQLLNLVKR